MDNNEVKVVITAEDKASKKIESIVGQLSKLGQVGKSVSNNLFDKLDGSMSKTSKRMVEIRTEITKTINQLKGIAKSGYELNSTGIDHYSQKLADLLVEYNNLDKSSKQSFDRIQDAADNVSLSKLRTQLETLQASLGQVDFTSTTGLETIIPQMNEITKYDGGSFKFNSRIEELISEIKKAQTYLEQFSNGQYTYQKVFANRLNDELVAKTQELRNEIDKELTARVKLDVDTKLAEEDLATLKNRLVDLETLSNVKLKILDDKTVDEARIRVNELLDKITDLKIKIENNQEPKNITKLTKELQKAYIECDKLVNGLSQIQSKGIVQAEKDFKKTEKSIKSSTNALSGFIKMLGRMVFYRLIRTVIAGLIEDLGNLRDELVRMDVAKNGIIGFNRELSNLKSATTQLNAQFVALGSALLNAFGPAIDFIIRGLTTIVELLTKLFTALSGNTSYVSVRRDYFTNFADGLEDTDDKAQSTNKSLKNLRQTIAGFDELNIWQSSASSTSSSIGAGGISWEDIYEIKELEGGWKKLAEVMKKVKDTIGDVGLGALIAGLGLAAAAVWKLIKAFLKKNSTLSIQNGLETVARVGVEGLAGAYGLLTAAIALVIAALGKLDWSKVADALEWLKKKLGEAGDKLGEWADDWAKGLSGWAQNGWATIGAFATGFVEMLRNAFGLNKQEQDDYNSETETKWGTWKEKGIATIGAFALSAILKLQEFKNNAIELFQRLFDKTNEQTDTGTLNWKEKWIATLTALGVSLVAFANNASENIGLLFENISQNLGAAMSSLLASWNSAWDTMGQKISSFGESVSQWASDLGSSIANGVINGVNGAISGFNKLVDAYKRAKAEDYSSQVSAWEAQKNKMKALGIATVGAFVYTAFKKITQGWLSPTITPYVPAFANGGVITSPTYGLMGEYPGARSNPEIITPQNIMRQTMDASNEELASVFIQTTQQIIQAINGVDMSVKIGDDTIAQSAARGNNAYKRRTGRSMF